MTDRKKILVAIFIFIISAAFAIFLVQFFKIPKGNNEHKSPYSAISLPSNISPAQIVLEVNGKIRKQEPAVFDLKTIKSFDSIIFKSYDPWDKKEQEYKGVRIIDILEFLELDDTAVEIEVVARNNYKIIISIHDLRRYNHIFSYSMNEKQYDEYEGAMNKGPLAIAIDFNNHPEMDMEIYKHQLVWLVEKVSVR